jgi:hypothetical protein
MSEILTLAFKCGLLQPKLSVRTDIKAGTSAPLFLFHFITVFNFYTSKSHADENYVLETDKMHWVFAVMILFLPGINIMLPDALVWPILLEFPESMLLFEYDRNSRFQKRWSTRHAEVLPVFIVQEFLERPHLSVWLMVTRTAALVMVCTAPRVRKLVLF